MGWEGMGNFLQSGGTNSCSGLLLGSSTSASGTYNLNGGQLVLGSLGQGSGSAAFNFSGGTLRATTGFSSNIPMTLSGYPLAGGGGGAAFDPADFTVTLSGSISGTGSLTEVDSGTLILSGMNTYSGGTIVDGGTLDVVNPNSLAAGSSLTVGAGGDSLFGAPLEIAAPIAAPSPAVPVPEPGTLVLLLAGAAVGIGAWQKSRKV